jgi:hypothetical protein
MCGVNLYAVDFFVSGMSTPAPTTFERVCPYCEIRHTPPPGWKEGAYCSKDHRFACDEKKSVGYAERKCELKEEILSDDFNAGVFYDGVDHIAGNVAPILAELPDELTERLAAFFAGWVKLTPEARDVVALRLGGADLHAIAAKRGTSVQAASKVIIRAAQRIPALAHLTISKQVETPHPPALGPTGRPTQRAGSGCHPELAQDISETTEHNAGEVL